MFTHAYKGGFIHGWFDRAEVRYQLPGEYVIRTAKSYRAAQIRITASPAS